MESRSPTPSAIRKWTPLRSVLSKTKFRKAVTFSGRVISPSPSIPPSPGRTQDSHSANLPCATQELGHKFSRAVKLFWHGHMSHYGWVYLQTQVPGGPQGQEKSPWEEQLTAGPVLQGCLAVMGQEAKTGPYSNKAEFKRSSPAKSSNETKGLLQDSSCA